MGIYIGGQEFDGIHVAGTDFSKLFASGAERYTEATPMAEQVIQMVASTYTKNSATNIEWVDSAGPLIDTDLLPVDAFYQDRVFRSISLSTGVSEARIIMDLTFAPGRSGGIVAPDLSSLFETQGQVIIEAAGMTATVEMSDVGETQEPYNAQNAQLHTVLNSFVRGGCRALRRSGGDHHAEGAGNKQACANPHVHHDRRKIRTRIICHGSATVRYQASAHCSPAQPPTTTLRAASPFR